MSKAKITSYYYNVFLILLFVCGFYGCIYGTRLLWTKSNTREIENGWHQRHVYMAKDIAQVMIVTQENSLGGTLVLMNSIVRNSKNPVYFFIATDNGTMDHLWRWIEGTHLRNTISYEIKGITSEWLTSRLPIGMTGPVEKLLHYSRLFMRDIFPNMRGRVAIIDDDALVQGDINDLINMEMTNGHYSAFSSDCDSITQRFNFNWKNYGNVLYTLKDPLKDLKLKESACTFDLGVSVVDVDEWETQNTTQEVLKWIKEDKNRKLFKEFGLKPSMLVALYNQTEIIDPLWHIRNIGVSIGSRYDQQFLDKAKLLHWNGPFKPWKRNAPFANIWDRYYVPDPTGKFQLPQKHI